MGLWSGFTRVHERDMRSFSCMRGGLRDGRAQVAEGCNKSWLVVGGRLDLFLLPLF